ETGSGKEMVARGIHQLSRRCEGPFVPVDCAALQPALIESELFGPETGTVNGADRHQFGKLEQAAGGTLFLDDVQLPPLPVQTRLLRALQERQLGRAGSG